ncbi:MAG: hypothetical protein AB7S26_07710 [Sandaracinaceae bacterium]
MSSFIDTIAHPMRLALLGALLVGCGPRRVEITFHTPESCPTPGVPDSGPRECPLSDLRSVLTRLVRADGRPIEEQCVPTMDACDFTDFADTPFLTRAAPSEGVEVEIRGWSAEGCPEGEPGVHLVLTCDSFGEAVIELPEVSSIDVWCECPNG